MRGVSGGSVPALAERSVPRWGDLGLRAASAAVLAPLALGCVWLGGVAWAVAVAAVALGIALEWVGLCGGDGWRPPALLVPALVLAGVGLAAFGFAPGAVALLAAGAFGLRLGGSAGRRGWLGFGVVYAGLPAVALLWLRRDPAAGLANLLFLLLVVWASDIGAYLAGRALGGRRLAPAISPGKTVSGAAGGLFGAIGVGLALAGLLAPLEATGAGTGSAGLVAAGGVAAVLGVVAQTGDLLESWLKRRFGVKDSGHTIPGHGGLLDRLDGLLLAAPAAALLAMLLGPGVVFWR